jgi:hypothetical protein
MEGLLSKPNAGTDSYSIEGEGYWPSAEYQVYKYYASNMTGQRLQTKPSEDGFLDVYATFDGDVVRILAGTRSRPGDWAIEINTSLGDTRVKVRTLAFRTIGKDKFKQVDGPEDMGEREEVIKNGILRLSMKHGDASTAFAFEVMLPKTD